jgi:tetratricopeptide (TPR) repeat protein
MTRIGIAIVAVLIAVMVLQAAALLGRKECKRYHVWSGVLTMLFAMLAALGTWMFGTGTLVVMPPFGILAVQGKAHLVLQLFLIIDAVANGVFVQSARAARERPGRGPVLLLIGLGVGIFAALRVTSLAPADDATLRIYAYDLWSPILLCWTCICVLEWALVILRLESRTFRASTGAILIAGITLVARGHASFRYFDSWTPILWSGLLLTGWALVVFLGVRAAVTRFSADAAADDRRWWLPAVRAIPALAIGLLSLSLLAWLVLHPSSNGVWLTALLTLALVATALAIQIARRWKDSHSVLTPLYGLGGRILDVTLLVVLALLLVFSTDVFYFRHLPIAADLIGLALASVVTIELTAEGPLQAAGSTLTSAVVGQSSFARKALAFIYDAGAGLAARLVALFKSSKEGGGAGGKEGWSWIPAAVGKLLGLVLVLLVVEEIPSCGKTLIYPFKAYTQQQTADATLGEVVAERMANTIGGLMQELRPEMLMFPPGRNFAMVTVADTSLTKSSFQEDSLEVGTTKVPIGAIVSLLKIPLESLFGARIVSGTVQQSGSGYDLLVGMSTGEGWHELSSGGPAPGTAAAAGDKPGPGDTEQLFRLADTVAYRIVSTSAAWSNAGMTPNREAFEAFKEGFECWKRYENSVGYDDRIQDLEDAIAGYRRAIDLDPRFAVAHYRLGLALRADGQPGTAIRAFQAAMTENPRFGAALIALASTLFDFDDYMASPPVPVDSPDKQQTTVDSRRQEAHGIWQRALTSQDLFTSEADRGSVLLGLCRSSLLAGQAAPLDDPDKVKTEFRLRAKTYVEAYYYCARADATYEALARGGSTPRQVLATRAAIRNEMAQALIGAGEGLAGPARDMDEGCSVARAKLVEGTGPEAPSGVGVRWTVQPTAFDDAAAALLEEAHALGPEDLTIACNWARVRAASGDSSAMHDVQSARMRVQVGNDLVGRARDERAAIWLGPAFAAYEAALRLDPMSIDAMNNYADAFWTWRFLSPQERENTGSHADTAERYARLALRLARERVSATSLIDYQETLGEVLLVRGRPHEAIEVLRPAVEGDGKDVKAAPEHPRYDEARWGLAEAYTCADKLDGRDPSPPSAPRCRGLVDRAAALYEKILDHEKTQEVSSYSWQKIDLDPTSAANTCVSNGATAARNVSYQASGCAHSLVLEASSDRPDSAVHVWGRDGIDSWTEGTASGRVLLSREPADTHQQYFIQLGRKADHAPLSPVYWFRTFSNPKTNMVRVAFKNEELPVGARLPPARAESKPPKHTGVRTAARTKGAGAYSVAAKDSASYDENRRRAAATAHVTATAR